MPFLMTIQRQPDYVRLNFEGPASLKNYFDAIDEAARETLVHGDTRGLADLREVAGRLRFADQFFIAELIGKKLSHLVRLAYLVPEDPGTYNSETVARRAGVALRSFAAEDQAIAWLLEGAPEQAG